MRAVIFSRILDEEREARRSVVFALLDDNDADVEQEEVFCEEECPAIVVGDGKEK